MSFRWKSLFTLMYLLLVLPVYSQENDTAVITDEQRARSLVTGETPVPAPEQESAQIKTAETSKQVVISIPEVVVAFRLKDELTLSGTLQFQSLNYRSLGVQGFFSQGWIYLSPRYEFQWGEYGSNIYYNHGMILGSGCTAVLEPGIRLFGGMVFGTGLVSGEKIEVLNRWYGDVKQVTAESGFYPTTMGGELGVSYGEPQTKISMGLRLFVGYERGMDWLFGHGGLTVSGLGSVGWSF